MWVDGYKSFYETFLTEMPQLVSGRNSFDAQLEMLKENLLHNSLVSAIAANTYSTKNNSQTTYWVGSKDATQGDIIVDTNTNGSYCKVALTSKNPSIPPGTSPFASDLYLLICNNVAKDDLIFTSDNILSDDALRLWAGMSVRGNNISVYDTGTNKYVLKPVMTEQELMSYVGSSDKRRYLFVLSTSVAESRGIITTFAIMEIKRLAGWPIFEGIVK